MKTGVLMTVYNEATWLETAINGVKDSFDEIVIVEGAYQDTIKTGRPPRSDDGTLDILDKYTGNSNVTIVHKNEEWSRDQVNAGVNILKDLDVSWMLLVDGDEIWTKNNLNIIKKYMKMGEAQGIYQYRVYLYNFVNFFDNYYDAVMKRVFKITPEATVVDANGLAWPDHGKGPDVGTPQSHLSVIPPICRCFHYTDIRPASRWTTRKKYLEFRSDNPMFQNWKVTPEGYVGGTKEKFKKFTKKHPPEVQEHYLYKMWEENKELFLETLLRG
jgi:glycosyltransferase involved in cell wall biosynthesis